MKNLILLSFLFLSTLLFSQSASKINNAQNVPVINPDPDVFISCDGLPSGMWRVIIKDGIVWDYSQILGIRDSTKILSSRLIGDSLTGIRFKINTKLNISDTNSMLSPYLRKNVASLLYEPIFSKNTAFNKNFGTTAGTIAQGDDSRIINGQTAFGWGNHAGLYPLYNGLGATGIWAIGISGNSATTTKLATPVLINGQSFDGSSNITIPVGGTGTVTSVGIIPGTGIGVTSGSPVTTSGNITLVNTAPDQTVVLTPGQNTKITGTYPNFSISDSTTVKAYGSSGRINQNIKIWTSTVTPSTSNGYSIDISSAGFSTILSTNVIAIRNTSSAASSPNVSIKSKSNTALVVNVVEDNPATIAILGISVLSGLPSVFASLPGLTLDVTVIGY